jgi:UDP-4-amino-4,6-dideoxy-N-acetyl-beta-L-altrosamine N-acetyltransferase
MTEIHVRRGYLRPMTEADIPSVLRWRNDPEVRRYMYTTHEIAPEEHRRWFDRCSRDSTRALLVFEKEALPLGFVSFSSIGRSRVADWGFYLAPEAPKGTGWELGQSALAYAFGHLGLHKLCGEALAFNERSIRFHLKMGFQQEGLLRDQHFDGESYHTIVRFGLLQQEWELLTEP